MNFWLSERYASIKKLTISVTSTYFDTGKFVLIKTCNTELRSSNEDQLQSGMMLRLDAITEDKD